MQGSQKENSSLADLGDPGYGPKKSKTGERAQHPARDFLAKA